MTIDLNKPILNLQNVPIKNSNLGKTLAFELANCSIGNAFKMVELAKLLDEGNLIELDDISILDVRGIVMKGNSIPNIAKVQILLELNDKQDGI